MTKNVPHEMPHVAVGDIIRIGTLEVEIISASIESEFLKIKAKAVNLNLVMENELNALLLQHDWHEAISRWFIFIKMKTHNREKVCREADTTKSTKTIKLLETKDKYSQDLILRVLQFALIDRFWMDNLLSINSLRKKSFSDNNLTKFDQILKQVRNKESKERKFFNNKNQSKTRMKMLYEHKSIGLSLENEFGLDNI